MFVLDISYVSYLFFSIIYLFIHSSSLFSLTRCLSCNFCTSFCGVYERRIIESLDYRSISNVPSSVASAAPWRWPIQGVLRSPDFSIGLVPQCLNTVTSVQSHPDLFIGVDKSLELRVEIDVLTSKDVAMVLQSLDFRTAIAVLRRQGLVLETKIVLLASRCGQTVFSGPALRLEVVQIGRVVPVASELTFRPPDQLRLLSHLEIESSGQLTGLIRVASLLVTAAHEVGSCGLVGLRCTAKLELSSVCLLGSFGWSLLRLVQVIVCGFDATVLISVLASFHGVQVLRPLDLFLIALTFLLQLAQLKRCVIILFSQGVATVTFLSNISLRRENFSLTTADLLLSRGHLSLQVIVGSSLLIEQESGVIDFFL